MQQVLWWLIGGTRGGENRVRIIRALEEQPQNTNQLANRLDLNYKAVEHHIELLEENGILLSNGAEYGTVYFLTERMEQHLDTLEEIVSQTALNVEYE
ncbi:ArsR/SmtB family transcription factor [Haloferax volcanii]|uniref:ArsR/SmtB family transcription factor n=1 Tax=Haloferax volcanii TaxID=2246 RepID=UPI0023DA8266|nr:winged helix-turn-helix domain-containing protein [Haloferax lucentense]